jgi:hypothetical protein
MSHLKMILYIDGIALATPGMPEWQTAQSILRGEKIYSPEQIPFPQTALLSPRERRRASNTVNLCLDVSHQAQRQSQIDPKALATIFSSSMGDVDIFDYLCCELAEPTPALSPMQFHQSLHNSTAGYWGISTGSEQASTSLSIEEMSFTGALLEAGLQLNTGSQPVMLTAYDLIPVPAVQINYPITQWFCVSLVFSKEKTPHSQAELTVSLSSDNKSTTMQDPLLETLRTSNPIARSLPLLQALANHQNSTIIFDYLAPLGLTAKIRMIKQ